MNFSSNTPETVMQKVTTPDGKWVVTVSLTTSATVSWYVSSPDPTTILNNSGVLLYDALGISWEVLKGVILRDGTALPGTNNVAKLVFTKGLIWQENSGGLWWQWDTTNEIWVSTTAPVL